MEGIASETQGKWVLNSLGLVFGGVHALFQRETPTSMYFVKLRFYFITDKFIEKMFSLGDMQYSKGRLPSACISLNFIFVLLIIIL